MKNRFWWAVVAFFGTLNFAVFAIALYRGGVLFGDNGQIAVSSGLRAEMIAIERPWLALLEMSARPPEAVRIDLVQGKQELESAIQRATEKVKEEVPERPLCMQWGPLLPDQVQRVKDSLSNWSGRWLEVQKRNPLGYIVYLPREQVDSGFGLSELAALGVTEAFYMAQSGELQGAISLGLFRDEARARIHQNEMSEKGVKGAAIRPRLGPSRTYIEMYGLKADMDELSTIYRLNRRSEIKPCTNVDSNQS